MKLGDPYIALEGQSLPDGKSGYSFLCPSSCTDENFEVCVRGSSFRAWRSRFCVVALICVEDTLSKGYVVSYLNLGILSTSVMSARI